MSSRTAKPSFAAQGVAVSSPDRELYPGVTKRDVVRYYELVADAMLLHIARRLLTMRRYPRGVGAPGFVQQHDNGGLPEAIRSMPVREAEGDVESHLYIENAAGLVACVQMAVLELHGWGSRIDGLDRPDRLVFDLDPDPSLTFADVTRAAFAIRDRLAKRGIESWPLLSGGKGIHVVVPLDKSRDWETISGFAKAFAEELSAEQPDLYLAQMSKAERKGRIFIDWLRNQRGATAVMPFSTRAKPNAPVAMPVGWDELEQLEAADAFTVRRALEEGLQTPTGWCAVPQSLGR